MKKWIWMPILILLIILLSCQKQNKEEPFPIAQEVENKILSSLDQFKEGKVAEGAGSLMEAVLLTEPSEYMPEGFENKILAAKDLFLEGNIFNGIELVSEALQLVKSSSDMTGEKDKEEPGDTESVQKKDEPGPIAELVRNNILSALEEFKKGNSDQGVILILEALLLLAPRTD